MHDAGRPRTPSATLLPMYRDPDGEVRLVLIRRAEGGAHGGHLALVGGKHDPHDASMLDTALREAWEEIGLPRHLVEVLAALPPIDTRTSGFTIHPFLARIRRPDAWQRCEREVAEILEVRLSDLAAAHCEQASSAPEAQRVPFYRVGPYQLWGATYRILHPLLPRLLAGEWSI
jgi:8-oxo-dGTP pyrophosphatase MutT (NUDIX family)